MNGQEYVLKPGCAIISRTDAQGTIVDCNDEFVEASGYERSELIGKPHNLIRHPDMPKEAFRDMWSTLKKGRPWRGMVKNLRKDGSYYWVKATATPLPEQNGYMSVRISPTRQAVEEADALYKKMRADASIRLREGCVVRLQDGLLMKVFAPALRPWRRSIGFRTLCSGFFALAVLLVTALLAGHGIMESSVDGKRFERIVQSKDLLADILPPPLFVLESYSSALEMPGASRARIDARIAYIRQLEADFKERQKVWAAADLPADVYKVLMGAAQDSATTFFALSTHEWPEALLSGDDTRISAARSRLTSTYQAHRSAIEQTVVLAREWDARELAASRAHVQDFIFWLGLAVSFAAITTLLLAWVATRSVTLPVRKALGAAKEIARGNLLIDLPHAGEDEIGDLVASVAEMKNSLHEMAAALRQSVEKIAESSNYLATGTQHAAHTADESAQAARSIALSVEQLSLSVDRVSEHADAAKRIGQQAGEASRDGASTIRSAVESMRHITHSVVDAATAVEQLEQSAQAVSGVAITIKGIADQTNLLALNAAIEAARAGESGRGFAVVADEVRKLAEQTAASTDNIERIIARIQQESKAVAEKMRAGVQLSNTAGTRAGDAIFSIEHIESGSSKVVFAMDGIVETLSKQSTSARDIAHKIDMIVQGSDRSAQTIRDAAQASLRMTELSALLRTMASRFRITN